VARLNIEESLYTDERFFELVALVKSGELALGKLVRAWTVAQKYHLSHREIPTEVWVKQRLDQVLIDVDFAERTATGVRMRGQDEQFAWLVNASRAGKKSVKARRETDGTAQPIRQKAPSNDLQRTLNDTERSSKDLREIPEGISTSSSYSSSFSFSDSKTERAGSHTRTREGISNQSNQETEKPEIPSEGISRGLVVGRLVPIWLATLKHFGIDRPMRAGEDIKIYELARRHGADACAEALEGMRYDPGGKGFDPKRWCQLPRLFDDANFTRYADYAVSERKKQQVVTSYVGVDPASVFRLSARQEAESAS
jgi:hypothetical protein